MTTLATAHEGMSSRRFVAWLLAITAVGLIVRVSYVVFVYRFRTISGDPEYYHLAANLLADGQGFVHPFSSLQGITEPGADHPPLYTLYLAAFSLIGIKSVTGHMLVSCVLGSASIAVGGLVGRRIGGSRLGLIAAALLALYPNVWRFDAMVLSETMVIFVVNVTLLLAYRYLAAPSVGRLAWVSGAVALCALSRSELLLLSILLVVPLALTTTTERLRTRIAWIAVAAAVCCGALAPWVGYNLRRFERPVLLSSQFEATFALANCDDVYWGPYTGYWDFDCGLIELAAQGVEIPTTNDGARERLMFDHAMDYVRSHTGRWVVVEGIRLARIVNLWNPPNAIDIETFVEGNPRKVAQLAYVAFWPMMIGSVLGVVALRRRKVPVFPLLAPCGAVLVTVLLFYASTRFRAAAEAALCLLTAAAVEAAWQKRSRGTSLELTV